MRRWLEWGGYAAGAVLIAFGIAVIALALNGRSTVHDSLKDEKIMGTPDMTPAAIAKEAKQAGLPASVSLPTCSVANQPVNDGASARCFAQYMRIHALEATGGQTYAQMPRYATADGQGTNDAAAAQKGPSGQPLDNPVRNLWITETALTTALNASFLAENVALFGIVVGIALLLTGLGFGVLVIGGSLRGREEAAKAGKRSPETARAVPAI